MAVLRGRRENQLHLATCCSFASSSEFCLSELSVFPSSFVRTDGWSLRVFGFTLCGSIDDKYVRADWPWIFVAVSNAGKAADEIFGGADLAFVGVIGGFFCLVGVTGDRGRVAAGSERATGGGDDGIVLS